MTSVNDIYLALTAAAQAGRLSGDSPPGLSDLLGTLALTEMSIQGGQAQIGTDSAWLTATTVFLNTSWSLRLTGRDAGTTQNPNLCALTLSLEAAAQPTLWTFGQAFPGATLPASRRETSEPGGGLILGPSVIAPLEVQQAVLLAANDPAGASPLPRLQGWLMLGGSDLAVYTKFLGTARLWMDGTVDFKTPTKPLLLLKAGAPGVTFDVGGIALSAIGIELRTDYPDPYPLPDQGAFTSVALVYATFAVPSTPPRYADISAPLLNGDYIWPLYVNFLPDPLTLSDGISLLTYLVGGSDAGSFALPSGIAALDLFGISDLEFGIDPPQTFGEKPKLDYTSVTVTSTSSWNPPVPFICINQVGVRWMFDWSTSSETLITASIFGTMTFGSKKQGSLGARVPSLMLPGAKSNSAVDPADTGVTLNVQLELPDLVFTARTDGDIEIPIAQGFLAYFDTTPPDVEPGLKITNIAIEASLLRQTYSGTMRVEGTWPVQAGSVTFNLDSIEFWVSISQGTFAGQILGTTSVAIPDEEPALLLISANYPGDGHWTFEGGLFRGPLNLPKFVAAFLGLKYPDWMKSDTFSIELVDFFASYSTAPGHPYKVRAKLVAKLKDTVIGIPVSLTAAAEIEYREKKTSDGQPLALMLPGDTPEMTHVGSVSGSFAVNRFVVSAGVSFRENEKTYTFSIAYRDLKLIGTTSWVGEDAAKHQVLTVRLEGATLGSVVEYFVNLANPNANYRLEAPWDFLNSIDLSRFALVIDPTKQTIALTYDISLNLVFIQIDSVGLLYDRSSGKPSVKFVLTGKFLDRERRGDNSLTWDAVNDAPPAIPGKGQQLFDLRYLGLGQHFTLVGLTQFNSISDVLDSLRTSLVPLEDDSKKVPIDQTKLAFDEASQWMLGVDCTFMDTLTLKLVMHDPDLYGVLLSLAGPEAGSMAGFSFELLYKKVTKDIGVFHARLQVPDAFRKLQFGAVSVTLGIITVDVYTNGNFRIDLGFPHDRDFSVSFAVEAGIFNGHGGIYFGLLDSATSSRVPAITNGTFSPVIELGVGLMVGVGRTYEKGPLSAGLYVDLTIIFEGVLGWFHPTDAGASTAMYYWCRGTAGIVGKLYGSVDFKIISVSISVEAHATVTLTLAAYEPTLVELDVSVDVEASVKILFVSFSFSFSLNINASFTIGSSSTPPWTLAANQGNRGQHQLALSAHAPRRRRPADVAAVTRHAYLQARFGRSAVGLQAGTIAAITRCDSEDSYHLVFDPNAKIFPNGETRTATLKMVPAFTVADVPVKWSGQGEPPPNPDPHYKIAFMLSADSAVPTDAASIADTHTPTVALNAHALTPADTTFNQVAEGMLRWSLNAMEVTLPTAQITLGQLEELVCQLSRPEAASRGMTWANLEGFLKNNLHFLLSGIPSGGQATVVGGVPFPMIPPLQWNSPDLPAPYADRQFWSYQMVDATYESKVLQYFSELDPRHADDQPDAATRLAAAVNESAEAMAQFVFRDCFLMVARAAAQAAVDLLSAFSHEIAPIDSLSSIAAGFPQTQVEYRKTPDDSVDHVAYVFGLSVTELLALNPGFTETLAAAKPGDALSVTLGVTPESIAVANPNWPVASGKTIHLGTLTVSVQEGDTLRTIAARNGVTPDAWLRSALLLDAPQLLRAGARLAPSAFNYANPSALSVDMVAAVFYVRLPMRASDEAIPFVDWYAEAIVSLNGQSISHGSPLPDTVYVPSGYNQLSPPWRPWTPLPGDALDEVASYFALADNVVQNTPFASWRDAVRHANLTPPAAGVALPNTTVAKVAPRDTLTTLARRLLIDPQSTTFRALVENADILQPLAFVQVPGANRQTPGGQTLITLAQSYGLSLEEFASRIAGDAGVLAEDSTRKLIVPNVPALRLDVLTSKLHEGRPAATIAGQVARFMLHGLRLPAPVEQGGVYHATGPMTGIYDLIGQQVPGPAPDPTAAPSTVRLTLTVRKGQPADWLSFADSTTVSHEQTVAALENLHPALHNLNPAIAGRTLPALTAVEGELPNGMIVLTALTDSLTLRITEQQLADGYPDTGLVPALKGAIRALPLARLVPVRHPVNHVIRWQTTVSPELPMLGGISGATVVPSLWLLPADLMSTAADGVSASDYHLNQVTPQAGPSSAPVELSAYAWATIVDIGVHRVPGLSGTVELHGADTVDRQRIALLLDYLRAVPGKTQSTLFPPPPPDEHVRLKLLWQLPPSAGAPEGLTSMALARGATFVVKSNLSTETHSGRPPLTDAVPATSAGPYFASIADADAERFLTLVWECSVVGGGGYWLHYEAPDGSSGIPDSIFDQDGVATLSLLLQLDSQSTTGSVGSGWPVRKLFEFNNCAVVGDGIDPGSVALFAQSGDSGETMPEATVQPGNVGFSLDLTNSSRPEISDITETKPKQAALQQLYSLVGYQLDPTVAFNGSAEGQPLGPEVKKATDGTTSGDTWHLMRVVPINRFAKTSPLPSLTDFPPPTADPYAGINGAGRPSDPKQADTQVRLWFHDVLGNVTAPTATSSHAAPAAESPALVGQLSVPVGYTDPLIGVGAWPSTTLGYTVTPPSRPVADVPLTAQLSVNVALQAITYQPGATETGLVAAAKAARDQARFARAYYQIMQPDIQTRLLTSLQQGPPPVVEPDELNTGIAPLRTYAAGSYVLLSSLGDMGDYLPPGATQPTLDDVSTQYGVDYDALGSANAGTQLGDLVAVTTLKVPQMAVFRGGDTVATICAAQTDTKPDPVAVLTDVDNIVLPLQPGTELSMPAEGKTVPSPSPSVNDLVKQFGCTLDSLVTQNAGTPGLVTPGFVFNCNGYEVVIASNPPESDATLNGVVTAFKSHDISFPFDAVTIVRMNADADAPGMFRAGVSLQVAGYVAAQGDTLSSNGAKLTPAALAPLNTTTVNLFSNGTPLFLQALPQALSPTATLGDLAAVRGITPGNLLRHNGDVQLAGKKLAVPGLYQWLSDKSLVRVPYLVRPSDTLESLAGAFLLTGSPLDAALALAQINLDMPDTITGGLTINVGTAHVETQTGDSFDAVCKRFVPAVSLQALVGAIWQLPGVLAAGALLLCPPGVLSVAPAPAQWLTPPQAAAPFGVTPVQLLGANAGTPDLIAGGVVLKAKASTVATSDETETTTLHDSVTAILHRFQRRGIATSVEALVAGNSDIAFIKPQATVLLAPADAVLKATLGGFDKNAPGAPVDAPWKFPSAIFPIHVWLQVSRSYSLVNEELRGTPTNPAAAVRSRTAVAAARQGLPADRSDGGAVTLTGFATALESAIGEIRVATGMVLSEQEEVGGTDVWAVVFSDDRIKSVAVNPPLQIPGTAGPQPRSFALRPLVNSLVARRGVEIQSLDLSSGTLTGSEKRNYQGVDLEVWARSFLADIDLVLSGLYVPGAYALNPTALEAIIGVKKDLAAAVSAGLAYVLEDETGNDKLASAVEALREELLISLSKGYSIAAVLQYDSEVATPWPTEYARFAGSADIIAYLPPNPQRAESADTPSPPPTPGEINKTVSVSNGRISLRSGKSQVNFLVYVPEVEKHETLPMQLTYKLVELEFNIVPEIEGYDRSDWLTFINPVSSGKPAGFAVNLGSPTVPLPLRAFPPMPTLLDHHADAPQSASGLDDAVHWKYRLRLRHQSAQQDEILLQVEFNHRPLVEDFAVAPADDLFAQLAQYAAVAAPLLSILSDLKDWKKVPDRARVVAALNTYATLARNVSDAWHRHWHPLPPLSLRDGATSEETDPGGTAPVFESYAFTMTLQTDAMSQYYRGLKLLRTAKGGEVGWPDITCYTADGIPHELKPGSDCGCLPAGDCRCYVFDDGDCVPSFSLLTYELTFPSLHIASYQNALTTVWVTRNAELFQAAQPATTPAFVYQTPKASYANPVVPFIAISDRLDIGKWSYDPATCPLTRMFGTIFDDSFDNRVVTCGVRYGYQLAAGPPPLESYLPVKQSALMPYVSSMVGDIASALSAWAQREVPTLTGGRWIFWIALYSTIDPVLEHPVLQLKRLASPLD